MAEMVGTFFFVITLKDYGWLTIANARGVTAQKAFEYHKYSRMTQKDIDNIKSVHYIAMEGLYELQI